MITAAITSLLLAATATSAQSSTIDLQAIAGCVSAGPIKGVETKRSIPATARSITVPGGTELQVSVLDGYRVLMATTQGQLFVNLKLERSAPGKAEADRDAIRLQMQGFASQAPAGSPPLKREQGGGVETLGLDQPSLDGGGPLGFYTLFLPHADMVVTAYLLNQPPAQRDFATYADYERLRDQALAQVKACLPKAD